MNTQALHQLAEDWLTTAADLEDKAQHKTGPGERMPLRRHYERLAEDHRTRAAQLTHALDEQTPTLHTDCPECRSDASGIYRGTQTTIHEDGSLSIHELFECAYCSTTIEQTRFDDRHQLEDAPFQAP